MKLSVLGRELLPVNEIVFKLMDLLQICAPCLYTRQLADNSIKRPYQRQHNGPLGKVLKVVPIMTDNGEGEIAPEGKGPR